MSSHTPIAIVGGGPCGLALALQLLQRKIPCVVFEKKPGLSTHPKAMGISRRSAEIFRQLGILSALYEPCRHLAEMPGACLNIFARSFVGEEWGRIPLNEPVSPLSPGPSFHCPQTLTEQVLFDALEKIAPGCVQFNQTVAQVKASENQVELTVGDKRWTADWLVAADGAGGQIRHELHVESDGPGNMGNFLNVFFRADYGPHLEGRRSMLFSVLSEAAIEFFVTVDGNDLWLMHHFLQPGETAADFPAEKLAAIIKQASGATDVPVEVLSISPWVMSPKVSRQFRQGRILFVGDAAARMSPAGGLGLNTGLQSTHNLAWKLAAVVQGTASSALLDSYEQERRSAALWTLENTNRNAGEIFAIVQAAVKQDWPEVRNLIAKNGRAGSRLGIDLGIEYPNGALIPDGTEPIARQDPVNDYFPNARPGSRAPHFVLADGRSILDLMGPGFTLLAAETAPKSITECTIHILPRTAAFASAYGVEPGGCVLVRPDGYVAARWQKAPPADAVEKALAKILRPSNQ
jgi:putative polyketide hydroxylase